MHGDFRVVAEQLLSAPRPTASPWDGRPRVAAEERTFTAVAARNGTVVCARALLVARPRCYLTLGDRRACPVALGRWPATTAIFADGLDEDLAEQLQRLLLLARAPAGPALRTRLNRAAVSFVLADGREYRDCGIDIPAHGTGTLTQVEYPVRHRRL